MINLLPNLGPTLSTLPYYVASSSPVGTNSLIEHWRCVLSGLPALCAASLCLSFPPWSRFRYLVVPSSSSRQSAQYLNIKYADAKRLDGSTACWTGLSAGRDPSRVVEAVLPDLVTFLASCHCQMTDWQWLTGPYCVQIAATGAPKLPLHPRPNCLGGVCPYWACVTCLV